MSKDTISVNMNVYDIPILVEQLEKANKEIKILKEEYVMLQNASDEVEEEKDREIERLNKVLKYLELYFSNREDYELSQLIRDTKEANIKWLDKAIDKFKEIDLTDKDKRQIRGLKEEFKIGDK